MKENIKIALVQMSMSKNIEENIEKTFRYIEEAAGKGADLICFPEIVVRFKKYKKNVDN